jgi:hypothetical protein
MSVIVAWYNRGPQARCEKEDLRYFLACLFEIAALQIKIIQALIFAVKRVLDTGLDH